MTLVNNIPKFQAIAIQYVQLGIDCYSIRKLVPPCAVDSMHRQGETELASLMRKVNEQRILQQDQ